MSIVREFEAAFNRQDAPVRCFREGATVTDAVPRSAGRDVGFRGTSLFELQGGRIAQYREYFDIGVALLQLGFAPESLAKVLGRRLPARG